MKLHWASGRVCFPTDGNVLPRKFLTGFAALTQILFSSSPKERLDLLSHIVLIQLLFCSSILP